MILEGKKTMSDGIALGPDLILDRVRVDEIPLLTHLKRAAYAPWLPILGMEPLPYRADYDVVLADHEAWFVRDKDGRELGALVLGFPGDHLLIWSVSASVGGRGIGRALVAFAEAEAVRRGLGEVRLYTNQLLARNLALYLDLGYRETSRETTPDGRHVVNMAKAVGGA